MSDDGVKELEDAREKLREKTNEVSSYVQENERLRVCTVLVSICCCVTCVGHRRFWHATQDCVVPYVDHILHRDRFWAISIVSGSVRLWDLRSFCMLLSHVMRGRPLEGELTGFSWHLCPQWRQDFGHPTFAAYAAKVGCPKFCLCCAMLHRVAIQSHAE